MDKRKRAVLAVTGVGAGTTLGYRLLTGSWPWERPRPTELEVTNVVTDPKRTRPGESFSVLATVENTSDVERSGTVSFTLDGSEITTSSVTLSANSSREVSAETSVDATGDYNACAEVI